MFENLFVITSTIRPSQGHRWQSGSSSGESFLLADAVIQVEFSVVYNKEREVQGRKDGCSDSAWQWLCLLMYFCSFKAS
jgi:hypothetical protein